MALFYPTLFDYIAWGSQGELATGGELYAYYSGTNNPAPIYNSDGNEILQPIVVGSDGRVDFRISDAFPYRIKLFDDGGELIFQKDNVQTPAAGPQGATGGQGPTGLKGAQGDRGADGVQGSVGPAGLGVPDGGLIGQYLIKTSIDNYDTQWADGPDLDVYVPYTGATSAVDLGTNNILAGNFTAKAVSSNSENLFVVKDTSDIVRVNIDGNGNVLAPYGKLVSAGVEPTLNSTYNIGENLQRWANVYADNVDAQQRVLIGDPSSASHTDINTGTIDTLALEIRQSIGGAIGKLSAAASNFFINNATSTNQIGLYNDGTIKLRNTNSAYAASTLLAKDASGFLTDGSALVGVTSISAADTSITIAGTPTAPTIALNTANANTWTATQTFSGNLTANGVSTFADGELTIKKYGPSYPELRNSNFTGTYQLLLGGNGGTTYLSAQDANLDLRIWDSAGTSVTGRAQLTKDGSFSILQQSSSPVGVAGYGSLYVKTNGKLYYRNGTSTESEIILSTGGTITGNLTVNNNTTIGTTSSNTLTVNATPTFKTHISIEKNSNPGVVITETNSTSVSRYANIGLYETQVPTASFSIQRYSSGSSFKPNVVYFRHHNGTDVAFVLEINADHSVGINTNSIIGTSSSNTLTVNATIDSNLVLASKSIGGVTDLTASGDVVLNSLNGASSLSVRRQTSGTLFQISTSTDTMYAYQNAVIGSTSGNTLTVNATPTFNASTTFTTGILSPFYQVTNIRGSARDNRPVSEIYAGNGTGGNFLAGNLFIQPATNAPRSIHFCTSSTASTDSVIRVSVNEDGLHVKNNTILGASSSDTLTVNATPTFQTGITINTASIGIKLVDTVASGAQANYINAYQSDGSTVRWSLGHLGIAGPLYLTNRQDTDIEFRTNNIARLKLNATSVFAGSLVVGTSSSNTLTIKAIADATPSKIVGIDGSGKAVTISGWTGDFLSQDGFRVNVVSGIITSLTAV